MRQILAVALAFVAVLFAGTFLWEIINPLFGIAHHGPIHPGRYVTGVLITALLVWAAFWCSRALFRGAEAGP